MKKFLIFSSIVLILLIGGFLYIKKKEEKPKIIVYKTTPVKRGKIQNIINATAIVKTQVNAYLKIGTRATGKVEKMFIDVGSFVKKGQLIAVIDQREYKKDVEKLQYQLKEAKDKLKQINMIYPKKIEEAEKNLNLALAEYNYAKWEFEREKELLKEEFTTEQNYEKAKRELKTKKAKLELAKTTLKRLNLEYKTEKEIAEERLKSIQKELEKAKVRLSYTQIYSPIDGVVSKVVARKGETLVAGLQAAELVTILDPSKLEVRIFVDETDIGKVKTGQKVIYYVDAYPEKRFYGVIKKIYPEPVIKQNIVYYMAVVPVKKKYAKYLKPEMTVYTKIIAGEKENALIVPNTAIRFEKGREFVYVIKNGKPIKRYIKTGWISENYTEVLDGLKEGEIIAVKFTAPVKTRTFK